METPVASAGACLVFSGASEGNTTTVLCPWGSAWAEVSPPAGWAPQLCYRQGGGWKQHGVFSSCQQELGDVLLVPRGLLASQEEVGRESPGEEERLPRWEG